MKVLQNLIFTLVLFVSILGIQELNAQCTLQAHYMLDGNAADSSANLNHGTFIGGPQTTAGDRYGNPNGATYFDGVNDYLNTLTTFDYQERTVSYWFYAERTSGINAILAHDANSLTYGSFSSAISGGDLEGRAGGVGNIVYGLGIIANVWYHAVLVRTIDSCFYYVNGVQTAKAAANGNGSGFGAYDKLVMASNRMRNANFFKGRIDDVKIYDCALDSTQVDSLHQSELPIPLSGLPADTTICDGDSVLISMPNTVGVTYLWDNNSNSNTRWISQSGTYWIRATTSNDTLHDTIIVNVVPLAQAQFIDTIVCANQSVTVNYSASAADSLLWSDGDTSKIRTFSSSVSLTVQLYSFCGTVIDTVGIQVIQSLNPRITDTLVCPGNTLPIGSRTSPGYNLLWSTGSTQGQINVSTAGTYWCQVSLQCDTVVDTFYVSSPPELPSPTIADSLFICEAGDSIQIGLALDTAISFTWSNNHPNSLQWLSQGGNYNLHLDNDCSQKNLEYDVYDISGLEPDPMEDTTLCLGGSIYKDFNQWPIAEIKVNGETTQNGLYQFSQTGDYFIEYYQPCGVWTDTFNLEIKSCECDFILPNAFTPNHDNLNDSYIISSACSNFDYSIQIFNRWGIKVFENIGPDDFWDGTYNGVEVPAGVFIYKMYFSSEINGLIQEGYKEGTIRLYR